MRRSGGKQQASEHQEVTQNNKTHAGPLLVHGKCFIRPDKELTLVFNHFAGVHVGDVLQNAAGAGGGN